MTLHTRIAVTTPGIDPEATFTHLLNLLGATPQQASQARRTTPLPDSEYSWERHRNHSIGMPMGLGLPSLVDVDYSPTGEPLTIAEDMTNDIDEARKDEEKIFIPQAHLIIHMDTAYSYKAANGAGCGDLHAWLVREMGAWLTEQGASWDWNDESGWGWTVEWKGGSALFARNPNVSAEWGTLGDPDVGELGSLIPSVTRDHRQAFLDDIVRPALGLE